MLILQDQRNNTKTIRLTPTENKNIKKIEMRINEAHPSNKVA